MDISLDQKRLVTGGLDSKVKIWSTKGVADPDNEEKPRLLASMSSHTGSVTCVAFSPDGRYIASGSDDRIVLVSELDNTRQPRNEFGSAHVAESEVWTPRKRLVGHDNDVQDLAWSPDGQLLVSVGLDSAIIVWSGTTFEKLKRLNWHQSHVKGVAFDPANKFFVTCSDDRTARVVRYSRASPTELSFSVEAIVSSPFVDSPLTTYFRRCSWSPDGETIVCPNATNGQIPTVAIIDRGQWSQSKSEQMSLVGHEGTTEVARFSPRMYSQADGSAACVVATGGEDGAVAVWCTANPRPLTVIQNVAMKMITDMAWSSSGLSLFVSSLDGSVVEIQFGSNELGNVLSYEETQKKLAKYGNVTELMDIPQSVEQIEAAKPRENRENSLGLPGLGSVDMQDSGSSSNVHEITEIGSSAEIHGSGLTEAPQTIESNAKFTTSTESKDNSSLAEQSTSNETNSNSASSQLDVKPGTSLESSVSDLNATSIQPSLDSNTGANNDASATVQAPTEALTTPQSTNQSSTQAMVQTQPLVSERPTKQKTSITKEGRKRVTPMLLNSSGPAPERLNSSRPLNVQRSSNYIQYDKPSSSLCPGGVASMVVGNKRKHDEDAPRTATRKARDDATYLRPVALNPSTTVSQVRLATPRLVSHISSDEIAGTVIEARNGARAGDPTRITVISNGHAVFTDFIAEYASLLAGSAAYFWAAASETGIVYTYTPQGSRALPPLTLGAPVSILGSNREFLYAITATGMVFAWNMSTRKALFPPQSLGPCLDTGLKNQEMGLVKAPQITQCGITDQGELTVSVSNGSVYHYNSDLQVWERISESFWAYGSQFWDSTGIAHPQDKIGPVKLAELQTNEEALLKNGVRGRQLQRQAINRMVQVGYQGFEDAVSLAHLGNRVTAAKSMQSKELLSFVELYVRRLAERGDRLRLGELFRSLRSSPEILRMALDVAAEFTGVQTLVAEYMNY